MKVLELFSGTGSVGKCCEQLGWDVVSVDLLLPADHQVDIMNFDYKQYEKDEFDIVWASPPCTDYSNLQSCWLGRKKKDGITYTKEIMEKNMDDADKLVLKAFEIIDYFKPHYWFLENPATGRLKDREIMKDKPFYDVSYCMYSDWGYEKLTRVWTNKKDWNNLICDKTGKCGNMINVENHKIHKVNLGRADDNLRKKHLIHQKSIGIGAKQIKLGQVSVKGGGTNRLERYRIPEDLIFSLFLE